MTWIRRIGGSSHEYIAFVDVGPSGEIGLVGTIGGDAVITPPGGPAVPFPPGGQTSNTRICSWQSWILLEESFGGLDTGGAAPIMGARASVSKAALTISANIYAGGSLAFVDDSKQVDVTCMTTWKGMTGVGAQYDLAGGLRWAKQLYYSPADPLAVATGEGGRATFVGHFGALQGCDVTFYTASPVLLECTEGGSGGFFASEGYVLTINSGDALQCE